MNKKLILTTFIGMILLSNLVLAIPGIPHQFYGSVTYNGQSAPDGLSVVAKINGVEVASTTTSDGKYGYSPVFYVDDPNNIRAGDNVSFFVNGIDTGQIKKFVNGGITQLDLTVTGPSVGTTTPTQTSGDGGGGGGGGGGGVVTTTTVAEETTTTVEKCQEEWTCTDWSECKDGIQTRTCTDENNCGTDLYRPFESQPCTTVGETEETSEGIVGSITGLATLLGLPTLLGLITVIIVLILIIIFLARRKTPKKELPTGNTEKNPVENSEEPYTE